MGETNDESKALKLGAQLHPDLMYVRVPEADRFEAERKVREELPHTG